MKIFFMIVAAMMLQLSPAMADDETKHVPDPDVVHMPPGSCWTCTTKNQNQKYKVIMATSLEPAEEVAIEYCMKSGGTKSMCLKNLHCEFENSHHPGEHPQEVQPWYDWGRGADGYGYCYLFDEGGVLNDGKAVQDFMCDLTKTTYKYATMKNGSQACMQWTPYGHAINKGKTLDPVLCREGKDFPAY